MRVRRPPGHEDVYEQELLADRPDLKITLQIQPPGARSIPIAGGLTLEPGALLIWFIFPGESRTVGVFHDAAGRRLGEYVNVVRPPATAGSEWVLDDLCLDVWVARNEPPRVLDQDELDEARRRGWISGEDATLARRTAEESLAEIETGEWPPEPVDRWPVEEIPALRLKRDTPGTYWAALLSGRIIAYGLYLMGAVSATSIGFAALTYAFVRPGPGQTAWKIAVLAEAVMLLPLSLRGRLPATRWPRPALTDERSLFVAILATGLAVLAVNDRTAWGAALLPVYGTLGLFSLVFAVCRAWFDRTVPVFALAGLIVTLLALWILL